MKPTEYTYGTDMSAALRLEDIAKFFNPLAKNLIQKFVLDTPDTAIDLGCGPGYTTNMLSEASGCHQTFGLDASVEFLGMAAQNFPRCTFQQHDITEIPFPVPADIMYTRFLLCHLRKPAEVISAWLTQLRPDGLLFIDELDGIDTELEVFRKYLSTAEGIVGTTGASLYVGKILVCAEYDAEILHNECISLPVMNCQAASWFFPNTQTIWNKNQYVLDHIIPEKRRAINQELYRLKMSNDSQSNITWKLRRIVLKKNIA